jgi:zinc protease
MNYILGGGSFSSRLTTEIRSMRGWAYFAGSQLSSEKDRGLFVAYTGSKPQTTVRALMLMKQMATQMHQDPKIQKAELHLARQTLLNRLIFRYRSPAQIVFQKAMRDILGYPEDYIERYRKDIEGMTLAQIQAAAKRFLDPERFAIVIVGWDPAFDLPLSRLGQPTLLSPKQPKTPNPKTKDQK